MEIYADYSMEDQKLLRKYISPGFEYSTFKGIPMSLFKKVTRMLPKKDRRIKFRGPSSATFKRSPYNTIKSEATSFAVYYDNDVILHLGRPGN
tara:strand:- start:506 stop:784 length:279 start_codon:yes stop_codon:yes gene_type:complete